MSERELRIGDAERTAAADELAEHYAQGRLSTDEHHERLDRIWAARTPSDLMSVFGDLPGSAYRAPATYATANSAGVGFDRQRGQRAFPGAPSRRPPIARPSYAGSSRRFRMLPLLVRVALAVLLAVLVIAHLPLIVLALVIWLVLSHKHRSGPRQGQSDWHAHRARC